MLQNHRLKRTNLGDEEFKIITFNHECLKLLVCDIQKWDDLIWFKIFKKLLNDNGAAMSN